MSAVIVLMVFPALLALAAGWDLASYTIPNLLSAAIAACFAVFALTSGLPGAQLGLHLAAGMVALAAGFAMFAAGWIGGGDAKLFAAAALWFGFADFLIYTLTAALLGGGLTLLILMMRRMPLPAGLVRQGWIARLHNAQSGIPYGVALAAGALVVLPDAQIFHMLAIA
jgi:prepilin peptidase CpaA